MHAPTSITAESAPESHTPIHTVGFIGLGAMGHHMVANLCHAGFDVLAYDLSPERIQACVSHGARAAASVAEAGRQSDIVVTMLPNTPEVESVVHGADGLLRHPPARRLIVDMSTISAAATRELATELATHGIDWVDAPVSGGQAGASQGSLTIMAGAQPQAYATVLPVLQAMGSTITHVGPVGAGQTLKLCNQLVCAINLQALCEAFALARASDLDLNVLRGVLMGGSAGSWMLDKLGPGMIAGDTSAGFRIDLMLKDLKLVQDLAFHLSIPLPATSLVTTQYLEAKVHGEGSHGNQALFAVYDRMANQAAH